ncbi:MAG: 50S ribosomal protein L21 [Alphaproteobacteria bacterium]|nr:50S ribosomal protein L21 [Alphaproteobacteria bacterium]MDD9919419.1 50S ribosomal protein L21 [Alphaproteobacteria bacterium]
MYAIIKTGGKQIKVAKGDTVTVERLLSEVGSKVTLDEVLMLNDGGKTQIGTPLVSGASVTAKIVEQKRDAKVIVFKKKRRQNYRRKKGHRQYLTVLSIEAVNAGGAKKSAAKKEAAE